ncbi:alpha/beta hydrolase [Gordonia sp. TBRC 11910]|uniref:Alpha/beta hydrolase n=1 Tax=Gordonia asplenii TaxID=2725283 RepID=A0A848KSB6_9ACTN|nr:alpha/beta fold hydrolase [Gordonia asplenii]NMN99764.1 alpha/beta hydrolase [Gordonia asplenii]
MYRSQQPQPVVFIHGLWMHASVWEPWMTLFGERGYATVAPGWPGERPTADHTRSAATELSGIGLAEITDHYESIIADLPSAPIVIGHCFGGLVAQQLLARGFARSAVALAPAQFRGVLTVSGDQLRTAATVLAHPSWWRAAWLPSSSRFRGTVANVLDAPAATKLYTGYAIPTSVRPLLQVGLANASLSTAASVDTHAARGPLLVVAGSDDRTAPARVVRAAVRRHRRHRPDAVTEFIEIDGDHAVTFGPRWFDVANLVLGFLDDHDLTLVA